MTILAFGIVIAIALAAGILSRFGQSSGIGGFLVGGRSFGPWMVFILGAGESYSIGTLLGFPGGVYAHGASYGVWYIAYILLAYPLVYIIGAYIWRAGRLYNSMTLPEIAGSHFRSPLVERTIAASSIIFLIPWGQLQLGGLAVSMSALGIQISPLVAVIAGAVLAAVFILLSGVRAPAFVSYVKDIALLLGAIIVGIAAMQIVGGPAKIFQSAEQASGHSLMTLNGTDLNFTLSTTVFQMLGFALFPFFAQAVLSSKSEATLKKTTRFNPLYMLMYVFLLAAALAAITLLPKKLSGADSNQALMQLSHLVLPEFVTGLIAGGAALCAIVVLCGTALSVGGMFTRSVLPRGSETSQRRTVRITIVVYILISLVLTLAAPNLLLALINTAYYGITQSVVIFAALFFGWKTRPVSLCVGLVVGDVLALYFYLAPLGPVSGWLNQLGINIGLAALVVNLAVVLIWRLLSPAPHPIRGIASYKPGEAEKLAAAAGDPDAEKIEST